MERTYVAIDLKSFYASVECVERGLDALSTRLVVADDSRTDKTICLAVSPALKAYGIPGRPRLFEVVQRVETLNRQQPGLNLDYIVAQPRMALYMEYSTRIFSIYLRHVSAEDVHVYSIDEVFIDVTSYLPLLKITAREFAMRMIRQVLAETGITATVGIGTNMYLAKVAMDIVAKHIPADAMGVRIAELDEISYRQKLWNHRPLTDFWRVGRGLARRLESMRILTMGQLARLSLTHEDWFFKEFGVNAELLIDHAWGWEPTTIADVKKYRPAATSMSSGQVLTHPYEAEKARVVVREMAEQISLDLVKNRSLAQGLTLDIGYDRESLTRPEIASVYQGPIVRDHYGRAVPKAGHAGEQFQHHTSSTHEIAEVLMRLFDRAVDKRLLIRRITITALNLISEEQAEKQRRQPVQLDLFTDYEAQQEQAAKQEAQRKRERRMQEAMLRIKQRFGKNAILHGTSYAEGATAKERNQQIGGHKA